MTRMNLEEGPGLVWRLRSDCEYLPGGVSPHAHCVHGHTRDCPDPGECDVVWPPGWPRVGFATDRAKDWGKLLATFDSQPSSARENS
jgi:hypothetical protein